MNEWFNLVLLILVCYRLAQLIAFDEGPTFWIFKDGIFQALRVRLGAYDYDVQGRARTAIGRLMTCPYCLGLWIAAPLALYAIDTHWYIFIYWIAIAGGQAFLQGLTK